MKRILVLCLLGTLLSLSGCAARGGYYRSSGQSQGGPSGYRGDRGRGSVWIEGYWRFSGSRRVWVPGHWERR